MKYSELKSKIEGSGLLAGESQERISSIVDMVFGKITPDDLAGLNVEKVIAEAMAGNDESGEDLNPLTGESVPDDVREKFTGSISDFEEPENNPLLAG